MEKQFLTSYHPGNSIEAADKLLRPAATALRSGEDALLGEEELWYRRMTTEGWAWWSSFGKERRGRKAS